MHLDIYSLLGYVFFFLGWYMANLNLLECSFTCLEPIFFSQDRLKEGMLATKQAEGTRETNRRGVPGANAMQGG